VAWTVVYFVDKDGSVPVAEFEDTLSEEHAAKLRAFYGYVCERQWAAGGGIFEAVHGFPDLFEIRAKRGKTLARVFCAVDKERERLVLLHGFAKGIEDATPPAELEAAAANLTRYRVADNVK